MSEELKPGTPEYQDAYDKEMKRLETEAEKPAETISAVEAKPEEKPAKTEDAPKKDVSEELKAELEKTRKALEDTKRWGHGLASKVSKIEREREQEKHAEKRPAILDSNPGLEDAIKHVAHAPAQPAQDAREGWSEQVGRALPDVEALLSDKDFYAKAEARRKDLGTDWDDPLNAIRELSELRTIHLSQKAAAVAVEQARKDFEQKAGKRNAMAVPGGSGGRDAPAKTEDAAERYRTMSKADFDRERSRVMGY